MIGKEPNEPQQMPMLPMPEDAPQRVQSSDHPASDHPESKHKGERAADRPPEKKSSTRLVERRKAADLGSLEAMSLCPPLEDLSPAKRAVLARSIRDSGDPGDILIWKDKIIMGEERLLALELGMSNGSIRYTVYEGANPGHAVMGRLTPHWSLGKGQRANRSRTGHEQRVDQIHRVRGRKPGPRCNGPTHPPLVSGQGSASSCHRLGVRIPMAAHRTPPEIWIGRKDRAAHGGRGRREGAHNQTG